MKLVQSLCHSAPCLFVFFCLPPWNYMLYYYTYVACRVNLSSLDFCSMCESCTASPACRMAEEQHVCECLCLPLIWLLRPRTSSFLPLSPLPRWRGNWIKQKRKKIKINLKLIGTRWVHQVVVMGHHKSSIMTRLDALPFLPSLERRDSFNFVSNDGIYKAEMYQGDDVAQSTGIIHTQAEVRGRNRGDKLTSGKSNAIITSRTGISLWRWTWNGKMPNSFWKKKSRDKWK